jgi:glycosyltransferase involved in cell wall biosynthesis
MKKTLHVSIVVANYNNGRYLTRFINSIEESSVIPHELIIVDDGSKDNSLEILENFKELAYLKVLKFKKNRGFTTALNKGIVTASGKYVMRADPDDIFLPERIEKQYDFLEKHKEVDIVGCNVIYFNSQTNKDVNKSNFPLTHEEIEKTYIHGEHGVQHPTVCGKTSIYQQYKYGSIFPAEDYEIFARMIKDGNKFANISEALYRMRVHSKSSTGNIVLCLFYLVR